ncbi:hypothetical protein IPH25_02035 [bacterium]|nr:MAG: hypothetical protein IPG37_04165 [bacterium]QQR62204.1 MAG: hypothetical protein IPH25_02035 [bacterium]QQR63237.1 MAG: hypothetical protein IPH67_02060 [bacterium]
MDAKRDLWFQLSLFGNVKSENNLTYIFKSNWFTHCDTYTHPTLQQLAIPLLQRFRLPQNIDTKRMLIIEVVTLFFLQKLIDKPFKNEKGNDFFAADDCNWLAKFGYDLKRNASDNSLKVIKTGNYSRLLQNGTPQGPEHQKS